MFIRFAASVWALGLSLSHAAAPDESSITAHQVEAWLTEYGIPAAAVALIEDGRVISAEAYGELRPGVPADENSLFNIASMAKPVAAETVLRLAARGHVDLDEKMKYFWRDPDIANDPWIDLLTPRIALNHQTGFANWRSMTDGKLSFRFMPGTRADYSGEGYNYVARFTEKKFRTDFEELTDRFVFTPLGMNHTWMSSRGLETERVTLPHDRDGKPLDLQTSDTWNAADDLHTTIGDYASFVAAVSRAAGINKELHRLRTEAPMDAFAGGCPLPPSACPALGGFAAGWAVFRYGDETVVFQGGGDAGIRTLGYFDPDTKNGAIIFTNSDNGGKLIARITEQTDTPAGFQSFMRLQAGEAP